MRSPAAAGVVLFTILFLAAVDTAAAARTHVVQPGDTLYRIGLRYGVTVESIAAANGLQDPTRIFPGQVLTIPETGTREHANAGTTKQLTGAPKQQTGTRERGKSSTSLRAGTGTRPQQPSTGPWQPDSVTTHVVSRGDTLYSIARRHGTTVQALMQANGLRSEIIHPGQQLIIPSPLPVQVPIREVVTPPPAVSRPAPAAVSLPAPLPPLEVGAEVKAPVPMRVRRGPKTYFTTLALVAVETPLRIVSEEEGWYELQLPNGEVGWAREEDFRPVDRTPTPAPEPTGAFHGADIVRDAMRYLGIRYVWGGESPRGVDCSGFVYIALLNHLPGLARMSSYDYFQMGVAIGRNNLLPGDLVFFRTYAPGPSHVGIYVGDGQFIHASSGVRKVTISSLDEPYYAARYLGARRLVNP